MEISKNEAAQKIVGIRQIPANALVFDQPCELGYHCPVCKYEQVTDGNFDERLQWSEYNSFLWCSVCNKDYPSVLCQPDIDAAIECYLLSVRDTVARHKEEFTKEGAKNILSEIHADFSKLPEDTLAANVNYMKFRIEKELNKYE